MKGFLREFQKEIRRVSPQKSDREPQRERRTQEIIEYILRPQGTAWLSIQERDHLCLWDHVFKLQAEGRSSK